MAKTSLTLALDRLRCAKSENMYAELPLNEVLARIDGA